MNEKKFLPSALCLLAIAYISGCSSSGVDNGNYRKSVSKCNADSFDDQNVPNNAYQAYMVGQRKNNGRSGDHDTPHDIVQPSQRHNHDQSSNCCESSKDTEAAPRYSHDECFANTAKDLVCPTDDKNSYSGANPGEGATSGGMDLVKQNTKERQQKKLIGDESIADEISAEELAIFEKLDNLRAGRKENAKLRADESKTGVRNDSFDRNSDQTTENAKKR